MRLSPKKIIFGCRLKDFLAPLFSFVKRSEIKLGGQSMIEYTTVVALVMVGLPADWMWTWQAGIVVLGPYVIRSVNKLPNSGVVPKGGLI